MFRLILIGFFIVTFFGTFVRAGSFSTDSTVYENCYCSGYFVDYSSTTETQNTSSSNPLYSCTYNAYRTSISYTTIEDVPNTDYDIKTKSTNIQKCQPPCDLPYQSDEPPESNSTDTWTMYYTKNTCSTDPDPATNSATYEMADIATTFEGACCGVRTWYMRCDAGQKAVADIYGTASCQDDPDYTSPDTNDTCPDTYECVASMQADGGWYNNYRVIDCHGIDYADAERFETTSCYDDNTNPDTNDTTPDTNDTSPDTNDTTPDTNTDDTNTYDGTSGGGEGSPECSHPTELFSMPFQKYVGSVTDCMSSSASVSSSNFDTFSLTNCTLGNFACYYFNKVDTNSTDTSDSTSTDNSTSDTNTTGSFTPDGNLTMDLSPVTDKLDKLAKSNTDAIDSLKATVLSSGQGIGSKIDALGNKIDNIGKSADGTYGDNFVDTSLGDGNSSIGITTDLEKVKKINDTIAEISEQVGDTRTVIDDIKTKFTTFAENLQTSFTTFTDNFEIYKTMFSNSPSVELPSSGSCSLSAYVPLLDANLNLSDNLCSHLQKVAPFFNFVFTLLTQFSLIWLYIRYFRVRG